MDSETRKALQELLKILSEHPEAAEVIDIKIRPNKLKRGAEKPEE